MLFHRNYPLRITYLLSVIFGTWPRFPTKVHTINQINTNNYLTLKNIIPWIKLYFFYLAWLLIAITGQIHDIVQQWIQITDVTTITKYSKYDAIVKKLVLAEDWTFSLTTLINMIVTYSTSKYVPAILESFDEIEKWLESVIAPEKRRLLHHMEYLSCFWFLASYVLIIITMAIEYSGILPTGKESNFLSLIFQYTGKLCMMTFDLQFANLCSRLNTLFSGINLVLRDIQKSTHTLRHTLTHPRHRNQFDYSNITSIRDCTLKVEIHELNTIHRKLSEIVVCINRVYQIQITLNISVCFFNTVCVLFTTISEYQANTEWTLWISGVLWVTFYVVRVIIVCISANSVIQQVEQSKKYLSYINDKRLNKHQKYQVEHFLLRLNHTNTRFVLCGLMKVDTTLLAAGCLGILTYLSIALQYSYT